MVDGEQLNRHVWSLKRQQDENNRIALVNGSGDLLSVQNLTVML